MFVQMAVDAYADRLPDGFRPLAELYLQRSRDHAAVPRDRVGERTLVHGDPHLGNLFVDGERTGFLDWAVIARAPGIRDVAYVLCNSIPTEVRRAARARARRDGTASCSRSRGSAVGRRTRGSSTGLFCRVLLGRGDVHGRHGLEVAAGAHRTGRHDACHVAAVDLGVLELLETRLGPVT